MYIFVVVCRPAPTKLDIGKFSKLVKLKELKVRNTNGLIIPPFSFSGGLPSLEALTNIKSLVNLSLLCYHSENTKLTPCMYRKTPNKRPWDILPSQWLFTEWNSDHFELRYSQKREKNTQALVLGVRRGVYWGFYGLHNLCVQDAYCPSFCSSGK